MKKIHHLILGLSALLLVAACGPSRYTSSSFNLASVPEYAFIQPYSYIVLYGDDGKGYYNEESSATATRLITNIINSERFPFSENKTEASHSCRVRTHHNKQGYIMQEHCR